MIFCSFISGNLSRAASQLHSLITNYLTLALIIIKMFVMHK